MIFLFLLVCRIVAFDFLQINIALEVNQTGNKDVIRKKLEEAESVLSSNLMQLLKN